MKKSMIFAAVSIVALAGTTSFAEDSQDENQVAEQVETDPIESEDLISFPNTSALDVTLFPAGEAIAWGVNKQGNTFEIFRCNGDTGECAWMIWPFPTESVEQGEQDEASGDDGRDPQ